MKVAIGCGLEMMEFDVADSRIVRVRRQAEAPAIADPQAAVRAALDAPLDFPPLQQALTPDDHVTIVIDENLPQLPDLLSPILELVTSCRIAPELITLLCPVGSNAQTWIDSIPDAFQDIHTEVHDPNDRNKLSYLATTKKGRRLYLNRTLVDADQSVVLSGRRYDPLSGYSGAAASIFPALSDQASRVDYSDKLSLQPADEGDWPVREDAAEVCWLLGTPFFVQVIEGSGVDIAHVIAGVLGATAAGQKLLDERWRVEVAAPADLVVAGISGDPARHTLDDLARAFACAARVVKPHGRIVVLSGAEPAESAPQRLLSQATEPREVLQFLHKHKTPDMEAAFLWASAAQHGSLYLLSNMLPAAAEELFNTPLENAAEVQRLVDAAESVLFLPDAHKMMAVVR